MKKIILLLICAFFIKNANAENPLYVEDKNYISRNTAILRTLDKQTGKYSTINVRVNDKFVLGNLETTLKACYTKPPEETPENAAFLDIIDLSSAIIKEENKDETGNVVFRGWMFSSTPSLSAMEHPIYDIWLINCKDTSK